MASPTLVIPVPVTFAQGASGVALSISDGTVTDAKVAASAGISTSKMNHRHRVNHAQASGSSATAQTVNKYIATAAGTVADINAMIDTAATSTGTVTVDLKKSTGGGAFASVLSSVITINSSTTVRTAVAGAITSAAYIAGDIFQFVITATGSTLPQGLTVSATFDEAP